MVCIESSDSKDSKGVTRESCSNKRQTNWFPTILALLGASLLITSFSVLLLQVSVCKLYPGPSLELPSFLCLPARVKQSRISALAMSITMVLALLLLLPLSMDASFIMSKVCDMLLVI